MSFIDQISAFVLVIILAFAGCSAQNKEQIELQKQSMDQFAKTGKELNATVEGTAHIGGPLGGQLTQGFEFINPITGTVSFKADPQAAAQNAAMWAMIAKQQEYAHEEHMSTLSTLTAAVGKLPTAPALSPSTEPSTPVAGGQ